jgi:multidrug efflux pump subunit AcrA (membrane-fusion protein)
MFCAAAPLTPLLPARRPELVIRSLGEQGPYVIKNPNSGTYYQLGEEEHFLLAQLDGTRSAEAITTAFAERFGQALSPEELGEFLAMARGQGFLQDDPGTQRRPGADNGLVAAAPSPRQSLLYWRKNFFDPDRLFTWLEPRIRFFWTGGFLLVSAGCILLAVVLVGLNRGQVASSALQALRWETALWAWLTLFVVTMLHEAAHGLTCKHYGGEVHEIGFLLLFFLPCFYCNVSDAWLFKEKSKRLWVTFAGGYLELFLWALAVFVWRLTVPDGLVHYLAFVVLSVCGVQTLFNFNPLLKLDGYYLLSDWLEVPNLRQRALAFLTAHLRWLLWGAPRPARAHRGQLLLGFGLASWLYSLAFLLLMLVGLAHFLGRQWGAVGIAAAVVLGLVSTRGLLQGISAGEVRKMMLLRHKRKVVWVLLLGGVAAVLGLVPMEDRAGGPFQVRPATRAELRAPVAGFLQAVYCDEGDRVSAGTVVARLEVPDLASRIAQKQAEVREAQARLRLLEAGPRHEELVEQRRRVERARAWRDLAQQDLTRTRQALAAELVRLDNQVAQALAELEAAQVAAYRARTLAGKAALSDEQYRDAERRYRVSQAQVEQAQAERRARQAKGTLEAEAELARRDKEQADAQATLRLLEAGTRPEEIEAERARLARLQEEARYLGGLKSKRWVHSPVAGLVTTPRLKETVGQYVREGELIGVIEESSRFEVEIVLAEQEVARVRPGQAVGLKARVLPLATLPARVERVAPAAGRGEVQATVTIYGQLEDAPAELRPGMTGYARISTGPRPVGEVLLDRTLRLLRTELWW